MKVACLFMFFICTWAARADEMVPFCYNWGCASEAEAVYPEAVLRAVGDSLLQADNPSRERELLAVAVARMFEWAGERLVIGKDRAGNFDDFDIDGRMDCVDHSINTTRLLDLLERRNWLRFHGLISPEERHRFFVFRHRTAVIQEKRSTSRNDDEAAGVRNGGAYYAVDSWFVDPGKPVIVMPLEEWMSGAGPDVD